MSLLLVLVLAFSACSRKAAPPNEENIYLPTFLKDIQLGQTQQEVLKIRPQAYVVNTTTTTQWEQFTEDLEGNGMTSAYYDFEKAGKKCLVSIALLHRDEGSAEATFKSFGGQVVSNNLYERERTGEDDAKIYASKKGRRVTFFLPAARQKSIPSANQ